MLSIPWDKIEHIADNFGIHWALLSLLLVWIFREYMKTRDQEAKRMQSQIDSLSQENREYRELFLTKIKGLSQKELEKISPARTSQNKEV